MTRVDPALLSAVASLADDVDSDRCGPEEARLRLEAVRTAYPSGRVDLVAETEPFDGSVSYDFIVRQDDVTVSIAVTSGLGLPWPLRGVTRAREYDLLRVGARRLSVAEALATIDYIWDDRPLLLHLVNACIASNALDEEPVNLGPDELQEAADAFRRAKGLLGADDTARWLDGRGLSMDKFAELVARSAGAAALRSRVAAGLVDSWFAAHRSELSRLVVAWAAELRPGDEPTPAGNPPTLETDALGAVVAARRAGRPGGVDEWLASELPQNFSALGEAVTGEIVEVDVDGETAKARILDVVPAVLDAATRAHVEHRVFDEWLAERRTAIDVEWFWGDIAKTSGAA